MKVLLVANVAKEHVNKFHIPTIKYLQSHGWQVDVACSVDTEVLAGNHIYNMSWRRSPFTLNTFRGIKELKKLIAENDYDIIYCHTPVGGLVARIAARDARKRGVKVVYCAHGLHFFDGAPFVNWLFFYPMEKWMAKFTDMFITINPEDFERVKRDFNQKMFVRMIPGIGVNFDRLNLDNPRDVRRVYRNELDIPQDAKVAIYVAEILKNKNQQMLIRALRVMHNRDRKMYLLLPGPDHSKGEFNQLAEDLGLKDYVKFLGWRSDIGQLMAASDLCIASSIREGFGINLVEAQYCHLPVVAVTNRGHRAIINDGVNGFLIPMNDYQTMAERVIEVLDNKELYDRFANVNVAKYSSENIAEVIYGYLREVIDNKISTTNRQFFELLTCGLLGRSVDVSLFKDGADWDALMKFADKQSVKGVVFDGIQMLSDTLCGPASCQLPDRALLLNWIGQVSLLESQNNEHNAALLSLVEYLKCNGIESRLMKGQCCASYYIKPNHRQCGDIDLFVGLEQFEKAKAAIISKGITIEYEGQKDARFTWNGFPVELHRMEGILFWPMANQKYQQICRTEEWLNPGVCNIGDRNVFMMNSTFNVFLVFVHLWHHFVQVGVGLRQVCDWMLMMRAEEKNIDWDKLHLFLKELGIIRSWNTFYALTVRYMGQELSYVPDWMKSVNNEDIELLLNDIMQMGNFGKYGESLQKRHIGNGVKGNVASYYALMKRLFKVFRFGRREIIAYPVYKLIHGVKS